LTGGVPALSDRWPLDGCDDLRDDLLAAYGSSDRGHHDLRHLTEVLDALDELAEHEPYERVPVLLAAWFHDAVYDGNRDDEERSAAWALTALPSAGCDAALATEVARLVGVTAHHRPTRGDVDAAVLSDADLSVLAAGPDRYAEYVAGVRAEYAHVPDDAFALGRAAVLTSLADGPLFHTAHGRERWESRARANLARELASLRSA
jgi:predicted metal-dependent HD superfamily phosphohydrolase